MGDLKLYTKTGNRIAGYKPRKTSNKYFHPFFERKVEGGSHRYGIRKKPRRDTYLVFKEKNGEETRTANLTQANNVRRAVSALGTVSGVPLASLMGVSDLIDLTEILLTVAAETRGI